LDSITYRDDIKDIVRRALDAEDNYNLLVMRPNYLAAHDLLVYLQSKSWIDIHWGTVTHQMQTGLYNASSTMEMWRQELKSLMA
jgi:hypothetical protein